MENVKIESVISATITLTNVSDEIFHDICGYIESKVKTPVNAAASVEGVGHEAKSVSKPVKQKGKSSIKLQEYANMQNDPRLKKIDTLFADYIKHPDLYTLEEMTAAEYMSMDSSVSSISRISVAKKISACCRRYSEKIPEGNPKKYAGRNKNGSPFRVRTYYIPVPRDFIGSRIKKAREEYGLTTSEVSDLIGYDKSIIEKWECGTYIPSEDALNALRKAFGSDIFDNLKN